MAHVVPVHVAKATHRLHFHTRADREQATTRMNANGVTPQPDEKTATGREVDSIDNLIRE